MILFISSLVQCNNLLQLDYAAEQLTPGAIALKAQKEFSSDPATEKQLIVISDFQDKGQQQTLDIENVSLHYVQLRPVIENNIAIDSVYPVQSETNKLSLIATLSTQERRETNVPVSLYNSTAPALIAVAAAGICFVRRAFVPLALYNVTEELPISFPS